MKSNFYNPERWRSTSLWYRFIHEVHPAKTSERTQDGLNINIVICDDLEHEKKHRFLQKVFGRKKRP